MLSSLLTVYPLIPGAVGDLVYLPFQVGTEIVVLVYRILIPSASV